MTRRRPVDPKYLPRRKPRFEREGTFSSDRDVCPECGLTHTLTNPKRTRTTVISHAEFVARNSRRRHGSGASH